MKYTFKTKPDPFQRDALIQALKLKRYGVFFQQRVGKTKTAIDYIMALHMSKGYTRILVTTPLIGIGVWEEQLEEHSPLPYTFKTLPQTEKGRQKFAASPINGVVVLCVTHGTLRGALKYLQAWKPEVIVVDELHCFKDPNSKRSKAAYKLTKDLEYVLGLTGTPIPKRPDDMFGIWKVLRPEVFGTSRPKFREKYCIMGGYYDKDVIGYKDKEAMSNIVAPYSIRVLRKDVMNEPKMEPLIVPVTLEPSARKQYIDLQKQFIAELDSGKRVTADMAGVRATRLQQLCGGFLPADHPDPDVKDMVRVSYAKEKALFDLLYSLHDQDEKCVVFCRFLPEIHAITESLKRNKLPHLVMTGATSGFDRKAAVATFQHSEKPMIMLMQETVGSMAICLDTAHTNIYYSMTFSLVDFQQSRDRVMGRGQTCDVTNYMLGVKNSVDYRVMSVLKKDEDLSAEIGDKYRWLIS